HHRLHGRRHVVFVYERHLRLAVRPQVGEVAATPDLGQAPRHAVGQRDGQGHELGGLVYRGPEHEPLVSRADQVVRLAAGGLLGVVDAARDVACLLGQRYQHSRMVRVEPVSGVRIADVARSRAHLRLDVDVRGRRDLARHERQTLGQKGLDRRPGRGVLLEDRVKDAVADAVCERVRVTLGDGFRGNEFRHSCSMRRWGGGKDNNGSYTSYVAPTCLSIRPARASDASAVTRLLAGIYREERYFVGDGPGTSASLAARIGMDDSQRSLYLVAVRGPAVGGWCELHRSPAWRLEHVAVLTLAVSPSERRNGVGRSLLREAYAWCRKVGVLKVSLHVRAGNDAAIALYGSEGFALEGREVGQVRLEPGGRFEDNLIMGKWLVDGDVLDTRRPQ